MSNQLLSKPELRPIEPDDQEFLFRVYASTREQELAVVPWTDAEKKGFLRFQFNAQHAHYQQHYADASFQLILQDNCPIGRLYVARSNSEIRIVDIALLPEFCGVGIGGALLTDILNEAKLADKFVTIHVEKFNPAKRLYLRLGFQEIEDVGPYVMMKWSPDSATAK